MPGTRRALGELHHRGTAAPAGVQGAGPLAPAEVSYVCSGVRGAGRS
jgi:hypothetical protein